MADAAAEMEEGGMVRTFKDLFAGAAGGIAQVLLGESPWLVLNLGPIPNHQVLLCSLISRAPQKVGRSTSVLIFFSLSFIFHHLALLKGASSIFVS
jgi:hypothetical protein